MDVGKELPDIDIERHGTGGEQWFTIHCANNVTTVRGGRIVSTAHGELIHHRLQAAYPDARIQPRAIGHDKLKIEAGTQQNWDEVRRIHLYRIIMDWEQLTVEIGAGPNFREIQVRTSRLLYGQEMVELHTELHVIATLITDNYGGSPLYSLVPELGKPSTSTTQLARFLGVRSTARG